MYVFHGSTIWFSFSKINQDLTGITSKHDNATAVDKEASGIFRVMHYYKHSLPFRDTCLKDSVLEHINATCCTVAGLHICTQSIDTCSIHLRFSRRMVHINCVVLSVI